MFKQKKFLLSIVTCSLLLPLEVFGYSINLEFGEGISSSQKTIFKDAKYRWEKIITNDDLEKVSGNEDYDIVIQVEAKYIDGVYNILGQAGPTEFRQNGYLPSKATMCYDTADLDNMEKNGSLKNVVLHEMAHTLGYGTIWEQLKLVKDYESKPYFTGINSINAYKRLRNSQDGYYVPLEDGSVEGTSRVHWNESIFKNELMTGELDDGYNPLSILTIASFKDLGYEVDYSQADNYSLPQPVTQHYLYNNIVYQTVLPPSQLNYKFYSGGKVQTRPCVLRPIENQSSWFCNIL